MQGLSSLFEVLLGFMDKGGDVLWLIAGLLLVMWMLIFERVWYFKFGWKADVAEVISRWESRPERKSWEAHQIRSMLISRAKMQINTFGTHAFGHQPARFVVKAAQDLCAAVELRHLHTKAVKDAGEL